MVGAAARPGLWSRRRRRARGAAGSVLARDELSGRPPSRRATGWRGVSRNTGERRRPGSPRYRGGRRGPRRRIGPPPRRASPRAVRFARATPRRRVRLDTSASRTSAASSTMRWSTASTIVVSASPSTSMPSVISGRSNRSSNASTRSAVGIGEMVEWRLHRAEEHVAEADDELLREQPRIYVPAFDPSATATSTRPVSRSARPSTMSSTDTSCSATPPAATTCSSADNASRRPLTGPHSVKSIASVRRRCGVVDHVVDVFVSVARAADGTQVLGRGSGSSR